MGILKFVSSTNKYKDKNTYYDIIGYALNFKKTNHNYICERGLSSFKTAAAEMEALADKYNKNKGTRIRHMVLSFDAYDEIGSLEAYEIAKELIEYYADDYQILAAVHEHEAIPHIHMIMNTVRKWDGKKYKGKKKDFYDFIKYAKSVLCPYGIKLKVTM